MNVCLCRCILHLLFATALVTPFQSSAFESWSQVVGNSIVPLGDGFGAGGVMNTNNTSIEGLNAYCGYCYAGVQTSSNRMSIWRSSDLMNWTNVVGNLPPNMFDMQSNTNGIFFGSGGGQTWKSTNGVDWSVFSSGHGYNPAGNFSANFSLQGNQLYMTTVNTNGSQVWERPADGSANWTERLDFCTGLGSADGPHPSIGELYVYCPPSATNAVFLSMSDSSSDGYLYETADGGTTWYKNSAVGTSFGGTNSQYIAAVIEFNGCLYAGTGNAAGAQIWRTPLTNATNWSSAQAWQQVVSGGFGYPATEFHRFAVAGGQLWTFLFAHTNVKAKVWRTGDGINWVQSNPDDFGTNEIAGNGALAPFTGTDGKSYMVWGGQCISPTNSSISAAQIWATLFPYAGATYGTPYTWLASHGYTNNMGSAELLTGSNGLPLWQSYIADLDPTNPASLFEIVAVSNRPPANTIYFTSSSNRVYALELTTNLMEPGAWTNVTGVPKAGNGGTCWLTATNGTASPLFRVQVQVP